MKHAFLKIFFLTTTLFYLASAKDVNWLCAQLKNLQFERLSIENGLSSNHLSSVIQDKDGFYWITSANGLNRFDGSTFKIFRHNKNDSTSISHNLCTYLVEGNEGDIWVGTLWGVCRFYKKKGFFKRYYFHHPDLNDDILNRIYGLAKDKDGNIWAVSYGLWKIDPVDNSITGFLHNSNDSTSISGPSQVGNLYFDKFNNGLWMRTAYTVNFFDLSSRQFYHSQHNPHRWPLFQLPIQDPFLTMDSGDCIVLYDNGNKKLYRFKNGRTLVSVTNMFFKKSVDDISSDNKGNILFKFNLFPSIIYNAETHHKDTMPFPGHSNTTNFSRLVRNIYTDRNNNKWFLTKEGAYITTSRTNLSESYLLPDDPSGFPHAIWAISIQKKNVLWIGTKYRLYKYSHLTRKLVPVLHASLNKGIRSLYNAGDSILWVGTVNNQLILLDLKTSTIVQQINLKSIPFFITVDQHRHFWVGTWNAGLYELNAKGHIIRQYNQKNGLVYNGVLGFFNDIGKELWIGFNGGKGFTCFNIQTKMFENFLITSQNDNAIESNTINALVKDAMGNLWLGTYGGGLYFFERRTNQFKNYRQNDGLSGDFINTLTFDKSGNLWISTTNGIDVMDIKTKEIFHIPEPVYFDDHGYINNLAVAEDGVLIYSCSNKITFLNPHQYVKNSGEATIIISNFRVFDKEMPQLASALSIKLPYNKNFFGVDYSVLKISPEVHAQYRYKLDGFDKDWNYVGSRGLANYTNVPPGSYKLLLNATNEIGMWNRNPRSVSITITPPFWETWWFYLLGGILILSTIVFILKSRMKQFKKRQREQLRLIVATQEKEKKNISAGLHDDLGVRLSALKYFVTSLKNHLLPHDSLAEETYKKTMATIDESVEDIRYLLINLSPKTLNEYGYLIAVEDLLNKLGRLHILNISLEQKNMEQRLQPDVEAGLYRITQELINNTLKHAKATSIRLSIERVNGMIQLQYADDGKGFDRSLNGKGYGMENIHTRVALLNGKIEWNTGINQTTKVNIIIPYNHTLV